MASLSKVEHRLMQVGALSYREFLAQGHSDAEWDAYRDAQNAQSKIRAERTLLADWGAGKLISGNALANLFRVHHIQVAPSMQRLLDDDATEVSKTYVVARGLPTRDAKTLLKFVSTHMKQLEGV